MRRSELSIGAEMVWFRSSAIVMRYPDINNNDQLRLDQTITFSLQFMENVRDDWSTLPSVHKHGKDCKSRPGVWARRT